MKNLIQSLEYLAPFNHRVSHRAAAHLVAREYVKAHPIPGPDECDAELTALYAAESTDNAPAQLAPASMSFIRPEDVTPEMRYAFLFGPRWNSRR